MFLVVLKPSTKGTGADSASSSGSAGGGISPLGTVSTLVQGLASLWLEHDDSMMEGAGRYPSITKHLAPHTTLITTHPLTR